MQYIDYYDYYYEYSTPVYTSPVVSMASLAISVLLIVAMWKIFQKAGKPGWAAIVPFYNSYVMYEITWGSGWHLQHRPGHPDLHQAGQGLRQERRLCGGPDLPALCVPANPGL